MLLIKNFIFLYKFHIFIFLYFMFDKFCNTMTLNYKNRGNKNPHPAISNVSLN